MNVQIIDRGIDCILKDGEKTVRVDKLSSMQLIRLLNNNGLTDIETVSFDEYYKSEQYNEELI